MIENTNEEIEKSLERAKEDLEDLEMYINEFTSFLPLAVCTVNPMGIIINVNGAFENLSGYRSHDIIGELLGEVFLEQKKLDKFFASLEEGQKFAKGTEMVFTSKDGKKVDVNVTASTRSDREGNFIGYFLGLNDISELKRFQETLEEQVEERTRSLNKRTEELEESKDALMKTLKEVEEERVKAETEKNKTASIITNFTDGLLFFDNDNRLNIINPKAQEMFSISPQDVLGKAYSELLTLPQFSTLINILSTGEEVFRRELSIDNDSVYEIGSVAITNQKAKVGTLVILHDVTREKMVERMKTEFVSVAAHQMRTPLSAVKWSLEILLAGQAGDTNEEQKSLIKKGYESNERMIQLVNSLLSVDRIESGKTTYTFQAAQLKSIIESLIVEISPSAAKRGVEIEVEGADGLPNVKADKDKIRAVMQNLVDNAVKYTIKGGKVRIQFSKKDDFVETVVQDTGIGIPDDQKKSIFRKFFRAGNAVKLETDGSGLGLFITQKIINDHGGEIWFESQEDIGSKFYFTLPIA
jgi:PAS domain S-box-containing protein